MQEIDRDRGQRVGQNEGNTGNTPKYKAPGFIFGGVIIVLPNPFNLAFISRTEFASKEVTLPLFIFAEVAAAKFPRGMYVSVFGGFCQTLNFPL